jgi:hypothetical protein
MRRNGRDERGLAVRLCDMHGAVAGDWEVEHPTGSGGDVSGEIV